MRSILALTCALMYGCAGSVDSPPNMDVGVPPGTPNPPNTHCYTQNVWEQYSGTWLLTSPKIHLLFWGDWWLNDGLQQYDAMAKAWTILGNDPNFYLPLAQYGINAGTMDGTYTTNPNLPTGALSETYIQTELINEINNGTLPVNDGNTVYVIELPSTSTSARDVGIAIGHHGDVENTPYAVIDYSSNLNQMNTVSSHEIYESATDPDTYSGWWAGSGETEVGDYCVGHNYLLDGYTIQQVWLQNECECGP